MFKEFKENKQQLVELEHFIRKEDKLKEYFKKLKSNNIIDPDDDR